ncbi:hypothetical protein Tcan_00635, partial [Toxocara canis]
MQGFPSIECNEETPAVLLVYLFLMNLSLSMASDRSEESLTALLAFTEGIALAPCFYVKSLTSIKNLYHCLFSRPVGSGTYSFGARALSAGQASGHTPLYHLQHLLVIPQLYESCCLFLVFFVFRFGFLLI